MESILTDYKSGKSLRSSLEEFLISNPQHELAQGMKKITLSIIKNQEKLEAINFAKKINYKAYEVQEQLIFLELLFHLIIEAKGIANALPIISATKRLLTPDLPPEWQAIPFSLEALVYFKEGNFKKQLESIENELKILGVNSGRYILLYWTYLLLLAYLNQFDKLEHHLNDFKKLKFENDPSIILEYIYYVRNEEMGHFQENGALISKIRAKEMPHFVKNGIAHYESYLKILYENELPELNEEASESWSLLSLYYLLNKNFQKALFWAKKNISVIADQATLPNFDSFSLIRAELANKHFNTAEYLLINRKKVNNTSLYDDYFWFRIYHNKGDTNKAQSFYNSFLTNVYKYKLDDRFDLEIRLSPEILSKVIRYYSINYKPTLGEKTLTVEPNITNEADQSLQFIIGESEEIKNVKELVKKFSCVDTSVHITGETGTGKELIAKALWVTGPYHRGPFIPINCGAISDHLLQSELFGHKKGAFTGAFQDHKGIFEAAENGVVFLDEIGEISQAMQISLLRVLEAREFRPVGSNENIKLKCKVLTATNRNLTEHVNAGYFRKDLQYRLERLTIELPPLRKRPFDIPILINHFLNIEYSNLQKLYFDEPALNHLKSLPWVGNIRELRNEMEKIRLFNSDKKLLTLGEISEKYRDSPAISAKLPSKPLSQVPIIRPNENYPLSLNSKFRRLEELKKLFQIHRKLTRVEIENLLQVSTNTAISYINTLIRLKFINKKSYVNSRTIYFEINETM